MTEERKNILAKIAYRQALLSGRSDMNEDEINDAVFYVDEAIAQLRAVSSYDPETEYSKDGKNLTVPIAENAIINYVKIRLLGRDPFTTADFLVSAQNWMHSAARERYKGRPDSWPDYPNIRQRLRSFDFKKFDPEAQDESDF